MTRMVEVDPERIDRWVDGFAARHGEPGWGSAHGSLQLLAADGSVALLHPWSHDGAGNRGTDEAVPRDRSELSAWVSPPHTLGLILVRRGGYAVGLAEAGALVRHHCGTRYVQSRTAAGGWSQQRFARRRGNQADALVEAVALRAREIVAPGRPEVVVVGGDRALFRQVLDDRRLAGLTRLPRRELPDLPDPRLVVLSQALRRGRSVRITLVDHTKMW